MTITAIHLTYFSGTGGTGRIADAIQQACACRNISFTFHNLDRSSRQPSLVEPETADVWMVLFPLHAFDAPEPIYAWLRQTRFDGKQVAVISASGGGEAWPNTGCRNHLIQEIEERGGHVVYERMLCMPSNWVTACNDHVAMHLLNILPQKVTLILDELQAGKERRPHAKMSPIRAFVTRKEKEHAYQFPLEIVINENCGGCGICAKNCPVENITLVDHRPVFSNSCIMCFRCIYACPSHAMQTKNFMVLKEGYDLRALEKRMQGVELQPVEKCAQGMMWGAIRSYLLEREG